MQTGVNVAVVCCFALYTSRQSGHAGCFATQHNQANLQDMLPVCMPPLLCTCDTKLIKSKGSNKREMHVCTSPNVIQPVQLLPILEGHETQVT